MCLERSERNDKIYDENGSLISEKEGEKTASYQYDLLNRQTKVRTSDGREQENLYDGEGLRAGLKDNGSGLHAQTSSAAKLHKKIEID